MLVVVRIELHEFLVFFECVGVVFFLCVGLGKIGAVGGILCVDAGQSSKERNSFVGFLGLHVKLGKQSKAGFVIRTLFDRHFKGFDTAFTVVFFGTQNTETIEGEKKDLWKFACAFVHAEGFVFFVGSLVGICKEHVDFLMLGADFKGFFEDGYSGGVLFGFAVVDHGEEFEGFEVFGVDVKAFVEPRDGFGPLAAAVVDTRQAKEGFGVVGGFTEDLFVKFDGFGVFALIFSKTRETDEWIGVLWAEFAGIFKVFARAVCDTPERVDLAPSKHAPKLFGIDAQTLIERFPFFLRIFEGASVEIVRDLGVG